VVSSEVIEHLDPPDLDKYWDIHLGVLKPNKLIVTTPNREFNLIFEKVEELSRSPGRSYAREGLDYRVRHDDHRFEYTRAEFEDEYIPSLVYLTIDHAKQPRDLDMMSSSLVLEQHTTHLTSFLN
jgi:hypothetical protein